MTRKALLVAALVALCGSAAQAQDQRVEISGTAGYTFSNGVNGPGVVIPAVGTFNEIYPADAFSWGIRIGFNVTPNFEIGGLFNDQATQLTLGPTAVKVGDMSVYNYHGYFAFNFGDPHQPVRPYVFGGLGVTDYGSINSVLGGNNSIGGQSRFSTTWGAGIKAFPGRSVGLRAEFRWTPTYITSNEAGWWCGFYGCYVVANAQYSNQYELAGGIIFRF
jgi:opacity protein-like surface antigen